MHLITGGSCSVLNRGGVALLFAVRSPYGHGGGMEWALACTWFRHSLGFYKNIEKLKSIVRCDYYVHFKARRDVSTIAKLPV